MESKSHYTISTFFVVEGTGGNLLSTKRAQDLALIQLINKVKGMTTQKKENPDKKQGILKENNPETKAEIPQNNDKKSQELPNE